MIAIFEKITLWLSVKNYTLTRCKLRGIDFCENHFTLNQLMDRKSKKNWLLEQLVILTEIFMVKKVFGLRGYDTSIGPDRHTMRSYFLQWGLVISTKRTSRLRWGLIFYNANFCYHHKNFQQNLKHRTCADRVGTLSAIAHL